ncbi:PTS galactitol transporter subunit IIC [Agrilactobacillus yilanensis]|uniref:PTS galactitol transporter subunit IIC n=1 Tax=Agrilactobacillus yilanensis TaxID=2485997 RepID=A0ABW4J5T9_9LACO|nr:PTS transporter subunit IIC [Agrilactobacillus yilanensis]
MNFIRDFMSLGASVMMLIIFLVFGLLLKISFGKALKSGLLIGVGFVGLSTITQLLADNLGPAVNAMVKIYNLHLYTLDIGWPAASTIAYGTEIGAITIPLGIGINVLMIFTKTTRTLNVDLWNYWHFAFVGSIVAIATDSFFKGIFGVVITTIMTLIGADFSQKKVESFYGSDLKGISLPNAFCVGFIPFAIIVNKLIDYLPKINKLDFDADKLQQKIGIFGDPIFLGVVIGSLLGILARYPLAKVLQLGMVLSAVMVLIPKVTQLFIDGLLPMSTRAEEIISHKFKKRSFNIGMTAALVIGHPTTIVCSLILVPIILFLSVIMPGNEFLPLASLSGLIYLFPMILPYTNGNIVRSFIVGLVALLFGIVSATSIAPIFTEAANIVQSTLIPVGTSSVASIDFAASLITFVIYHLTTYGSLIGPAVIAFLALVLMLKNRKRIIEENNEALSMRKNSDCISIKDD